jgi:DNA-3-methyladenine glycosylase I
LKNVTRCSWAGDDPLYIAYHDTEWGVPVHDDTRLFELLVLEGFQAGLSWITILRKRDAFHAAFAQWDWKKVARFGARTITRLLQNAEIIRNERKIHAAINNAKRFEEVRTEFGTFDRYIWRFTHYRTLKPKRRVRTFKELPTTSPESVSMSRDLKKRGFSFVGPTICYAYMQSIGMVDDHLEGCFRIGFPHVNKSHGLNNANPGKPE